LALLLVVDDDEAIARALSRILESDGHAVRVAYTGLDALAMADGVSLAVIDIMLPGITGVELARRLRARAPHFPILFMTGAPELVQMAEFPGAQLMAKPWRVGPLLDCIRQLLGPG
jgi:DNA-binding response OmpR family regulator